MPKYALSLSTCHALNKLSFRAEGTEILRSHQYKEFNWEYIFYGVIGMVGYKEKV